MAPSVESQLLWVNKDVKSYKQSKRIPAAQAALINAHSQQRARAARTLASQQALRDGSAVKAIVGWRQRSVSPTASTSSLADQLPEELGTYRNRNSESRGENWEYSERSDPNDSSGKLSPHLAYICGKDEALDPFQCTAVKLDSKMHDLIQFYLARLHPVSYPPSTSIQQSGETVLTMASIVFLESEAPWCARRPRQRVCRSRNRVHSGQGSLLLLGCVYCSLQGKFRRGGPKGSRRNLPWPSPRGGSRTSPTHGLCQEGFPTKYCEHGYLRRASRRLCRVASSPSRGQVRS